MEEENKETKETKALETGLTSKDVIDTRREQGLLPDFFYYFEKAEEKLKLINNQIILLERQKTSLNYDNIKDLKHSYPKKVLYRDYFIYFEKVENSWIYKIEKLGKKDIIIHSENWGSVYETCFYEAKTFIDQYINTGAYYHLKTLGVGLKAAGDKMTSNTLIKNRNRGPYKKVITHTEITDNTIELDLTLEHSTNQDIYTEFVEHTEEFDILENPKKAQKILKQIINKKISVLNEKREY